MHAPRIRPAILLGLVAVLAMFPCALAAPPDPEPIAAPDEDAAPARPFPFGVVRDEDGAPVDGAEVVVLATASDAGEASPGARRGSTRTDERGAFLVPDLEGDAFHVLVRKEGFAHRILWDVTPEPLIEVELERGAPVGGVVLDKHSGRPIRGATVRIEDGTIRFGKELVESTTTGEDGTFRFASVRSEPSFLLAVAPGRAAILREVRPAAATEVSFRLPSGAPVRGLVVDSDGAGVPGATVRMRPVAGDVATRSFGAMRSGGSETRYQMRVIADDEGKFEFDGLPDGTTYELFPWREDSGRVDGVRVGVREGVAAVEDVRLVLPEPTGVRFRLVPPDDGTVERVALVTARTTGEDEPERPDRVGPIDPSPDGSWVVRGLSAGRARIRIVPQGWLPVVVEDVVLRAGATTDLGELKVSRGAEVAGTVRDADGNPVVDARVAVLWSDETSGWGQQSARSGEDGSFSVAGIEPGRTVTVRVETDGFAEWSESGVDPADGPIDVVLQRQASIAGTVALEEGGVPPSFEVRVYRASAPEDDGTNWMQAARPVVQERFDGREAFEITGIEAGVFEVEVDAAGRVPARRDGVEVAEAERSDAGRFELRRGLHVAGVVVDGAGAPVGGAAVTVKPSGGFMGIGPARGGTDDDTPYTGDDGRFRVEGLEPGAHVARAMHGEFADASSEVLIEPGRSVDDLELVLDAGGAVEGTVRNRSGEPVADARIGLMSGVDIESGRMMATGPDGRYRFERVAAGTYRVTAQTGRSARFDSGSMRMKTVTVETGETAVVDFDESSGVTVRGTVLRGGEPVPQASMYWSRGDPGDLSNLRTGRSDDAGRFEVQLAEAGDYEVRVGTRRAAGSFSSTTVVVPEGEDVSVDVVLSSSGISGTVTDQDGRPVEAADVRATQRGGSFGDELFAGSARTGSDGSFRIFGLEPGTYAVVAGKERFAPASREGVTVVEGAETPPVELTLRSGRAVRGRVVDPVGQPVLGAMVFVAAAGGDLTLAEGVNTMTGRDGRFVLRGAPDGALLAAAYGDGYAPAVVDGWIPTESAEDDDVVVRLGRGGTIRVGVVGSGGEPRSGVATSIGAERFDVLAGLARIGRSATVSGSGGIVTIDRLMPGRYTVSAPGAQPVRVEVVEGAVAEVTLVVPE